LILVAPQNESGSLAAPRFITLLLAFGASWSAGWGRCRRPAPQKRCAL